MRLRRESSYNFYTLHPSYYLLFKQYDGCALHTTQDGNVPVNDSLNLQVQHGLFLMTFTFSGVVSH